MPTAKICRFAFLPPLKTWRWTSIPEQTQQVLTNLISNALKFTPSGGEVKVRVNPKDQQSVLQVADTGIGIDPKDLPHIFDRFFQVDGSSTRQGEGTGIGLAHTHELVKLMGGNIQVESQPQKGTTFTIKLPIRNTAAVPYETAQVKDLPDWKPLTATAAPVAADQGGGAVATDLPQLLIIEDNADVVTYLKACLADHYQLDIAYNGKIGIEKAIEHIPDLIISDVMMPEKDGFEVCDALKNDERTSHIPIILLTAKADASSKLAGLRRGADAYLSKPFDKEELMVRLEVLAKKQKRILAHFSQKIQQGINAYQPEEEAEEAIQIEDAFIQKVRAIVEENYQDDLFGLPLLCKNIGMSRSQLFRKMKALIDTSPSDFIRQYRLQKAKTLLETTDLNTSEVAWETGFKDPAHFSKAFQKEFGVPPSQIR
jgi:DNA-binding response OmpR family regulator/anti-sigma regulatory factor (Ser/Thr protein kinase)